MDIKTDGDLPMALRTSGFDTSNIGYFLYVNGQKSNGFYFEDCEGRMIFDTTMIAYEGTSDWVEKSIVDARLPSFRSLTIG